MHCASRPRTFEREKLATIARQWRIQGGDRGVRAPPSASTLLISQSMYDSLHDTAQLAPAPSEIERVSKTCALCERYFRSRYITNYFLWYI